MSLGGLVPTARRDSHLSVSMATAAEQGASYSTSYSSQAADPPWSLAEGDHKLGWVEKGPTPAAPAQAEQAPSLMSCFLLSSRAAKQGGLSQFR